jgi:hypothetical protein
MIMKKDELTKVIQDIDIDVINHKKISDRAWIIPLRPITEETKLINHVVHNELNANFVKWWHASLGSPTISTMLEAIRLGALRNIERLTTKIVRKNPPHTMATAMGHLDNTRQGQKSTNPRKKSSTNRIHNTETEEAISELQIDNDISEIRDVDHEASKMIYYDDPLNITDIYDHQLETSTYTKIVPYDENAEDEYQLKRDATIHTDATGRYPIRSLSGNEYMMVSVYKGYIHIVPMKNRTKEEQLRAYQETANHNKTSNHKPDYQRLDNETSKDLEAWLKKQKLSSSTVTRTTTDATSPKERSEMLRIIL